MTQTIYQDGKIFKELDFQILLRKVDIINLEMSINKAFKLAEIGGPKGKADRGIDYSRVTSTTPVAHIGLEDAIRLAARDQKRVRQLRREISQLRTKKRNLIKIIKSLNGLEAKIFYYRVIMCETQEATALEIGVSTRQLQRIERSLRANLLVDDL